MQPRSLGGPVHFSNLRYMARSPAHYRASILEPREQSTARRFGQIVHAVLFRQSYVVWPKQRRGKEWDEFEAQHENADTLIVTSDEHDRARRCCDAVGANPEATRVLVGEYEVEREWTAYGRRCAGRLDVKGNGYVTEFKTSSNTEPMQFQRGALRLSYHAQIPWYIDGIGHPEWDGFIVAVEVAPPFAVTVLQLSPRCMQEGRKLARLWMEQLAVCEAANEWPAYCQSVVPFDLPDMDNPLIIDGEEVEAA